MKRHEPVRTHRLVSILACSQAGSSDSERA